jgi:type II secretory pathway component PulK
MKARNPLTGRRGAALITTIIILTFLAVLGMSLVAFLFSRTAYSQMQLDRLKALYLAEAGISKALWELRFDIDPDGDGQGNIPKTKLGDGLFWTRHNFQTSTITGTGEVNKARRVVQIKYSAI